MAIKYFHSIFQRFIIPQLLLLSFSLPTFAQTQFHLRRFERGGDTYYAIALTNVEQWSMEQVHMPSPLSIENAQESPIFGDIYDILYRDSSLLEATDFRHAIDSDPRILTDFPAAPLSSLASTNAFFNSMANMLANYANFYKWEAYRERGTLPENIDFDQLKRESPLLREGTTAILILDSQKNFAGLVSITYQTQRHPLLPAQLLFQSIDSEHRTPEMNPYDLLPNHVIRRNSELGRISEAGALFFPNTGDPLHNHNAITELKSVVKSQSNQLDIMTLAAYLLDTLDPVRFFSENSPILFQGPDLSAQKGLRPWTVPSLPGVYLGTSNERLFRVHQRMGWERLFQAGDTIFMTLSRENYLRSYLSGMNRQVNNHRFIDEIRQQFNPIWDPPPSRPEIDPRKMAQELNQIREIHNAGRNIGTHGSCRNVFM